MVKTFYLYHTFLHSEVSSEDPFIQPPLFPLWVAALIPSIVYKNDITVVWKLL